MTTIAPPSQDVPTEPQTVGGRHTRTASAGLLLLAAGPLLLIAAAVATGGTDELGFFVIAAAVAVIGAVLVRRGRTWSTAVALLAGVLVAGATFWMAFGLAYPASFFDFVPGVTLVLGVLLGIGGCVAALIARRRPAPDPGAGRGLVRGALAVVVVAAVASAGLWAANRQRINLAVEAVEVSMRDFAFAPATLELPPGPSQVLVRNDDAVVHTFTMPSLGVDVTVLPGSEELVEVEVTAGEHVVYCRPHSNVDEPDPAEAGMAATVVVS